MSMWVASFSELPLEMRQVVRIERVGHWRKRGKLVHGFHYLTVKEAEEANLPVKGLGKPGYHKQVYVYNAIALYDFFKDKKIVPRRMRIPSNW